MINASTLLTRKTAKHIGIVIFITLVIFTVHFKSPVLTSYDSRYSIHIAESLVKEFDIDLDEYEFGKNRGDYALFFYDNHAYGVYPIMTSILAIPFVLVLNNRYPDRDLFYKTCERATAAFIVAVTSAIIFYTVLIVTASWWASFLLLLCFSFSTTAWSIASRGLWSHGPSMMLVSVIVFLLLYMRLYRNQKLIPVLGVVVGLAYVARPTNAIIVLIVSVYIFFSYRRQFVRFVLSGLSVAVLFIVFNKLFYGITLLPYYVYPFGINRELLSPWLSKVAVVNPDMTEAFWGNLISPNRGLFVFSPIFLFCFFGVGIKIREKSFNSLDLMMAAIAVVHLLIISKTLKTWWGGYSFGPRYFTDILPVLIYWLVPVVIYLFNKKMSLIKMMVLASFLVTMGFGIFVHFQGATSEAVWKWNSSEPLVDWNRGTSDHIDWHPQRVWDFHDLQFLREFRH